MKYKDTTIMIGHTTPLVMEELSSRQAAQRKSVSIFTIRNWIKAGKISARKEKGRYIILVDDLFHFAKKYQRSQEHLLRFQIDELQYENAQLRQDIAKSDQCYHELALLYDATLERAENLEEQLAQYKVWEIMIRCPEAVDAYLKRNFPDYHRNQNNPKAKEHPDWLPPLISGENSPPEIVYEPTPKMLSAKTNTIEAEVVSVNYREDSECK